MAAGVPALDTPYFAFRDPDGLRSESHRARGYGFRGKFAIHPSQIEIINEAFSPSAAEVEQARRVVEAFEEAFEITASDLNREVKGYLERGRFMSYRFDLDELLPAFEPVVTRLSREQIIPCPWIGESMIVCRPRLTGAMSFGGCNGRPMA